MGDPGAKSAKPDDKVVLEMVRFPSELQEGEGAITEVLGPAGKPGVDTLSITGLDHCQQPSVDQAVKDLAVVFRRMRRPLLILLSTYSITVLGLVLIPGVDAAGNPWHMDFFHAFYFVSFMGSTIGFGEIPYAFTDAQRMWTTCIIYSAVIAWLYAIGTILTLTQDQGFRRVLAFSSFARKIRRIQEPFYIICGYDDAGSLLVHELTERHIQCVVVDRNQEKILGLQVGFAILVADAGHHSRRVGGDRHRRRAPREPA